MTVSETLPAALATQGRPRQVLRITGRFGHGVLLEFLIDGVRAGYTVLPPVQGGIVLLLAKALLESPTPDGAEAHRTADDVAEELARLDLTGLPDPANTTRTVYRLRGHLGGLSFVGAWLAGCGCDQLIHTEKFLGYRLDLDPALIDLQILGSEE